ncbi:MAG: hypothetical protein K0U47_09675 [Epsilonproteobacteria bacterium]|nr:hypothetical protein [Campylobacterota bacterium]
MDLAEQLLVKFKVERGEGGFTLRTTIAGVVGGTASELGGGKFANGAVSGAFTHMFNHEAGGFLQNVKKEFSDFFDGMASVPKLMYSYGDYLARLSGFRDWQNDNILPWYKWEAELEYQAFEYGVTNHKSDILQGIGNDMLNRPNYYLGGIATGSILGNFSKVAGGIYTSASFSTKPAGAAADYIHTEINPLH